MTFILMGQRQMYVCQSKVYMLLVCDGHSKVCSKSYHIRDIGSKNVHDLNINL